MLALLKWMDHRKFPWDFARLDFCRYGTLWRKRTRLFTTIPQLFGFKKFCTCVKPRLILRGQGPGGIPWTQLAQPYPQLLADDIAKAM